VRTDTRTDMTMLPIFFFRTFANGPKICLQDYYISDVLLRSDNFVIHFYGVGTFY
jgi:hypothetical protein